MASPTPVTNRIALLVDEEMEPYVRKKRSNGDSRSKLVGLNDEEQNLLRTSINSRERRRMHDLNDAHEELRSCLPYGQEANARRLSKISTIMLASNWIRQLTKENQRLQTEISELRRLLGPASDSVVTSTTSSALPAPAAVTTSSTSEKKFLTVQDQSENVVPPGSVGTLNSVYSSAVPTSQFQSSTVQAVPHPGPALVPILNFPFHCLKVFGQPCICISCVSSGATSLPTQNLKKESF